MQLGYIRIAIIRHDKIECPAPERCFRNDAGRGLGLLIDDRFVQLRNDSAVVAIAASRSRILRRLRCSRRFAAIRIYIAVTLRDVVFLFLDDIAVLVHLLP